MLSVLGKVTKESSKKFIEYFDNKLGEAPYGFKPSGNATEKGEEEINMCSVYLKQAIDRAPRDELWTNLRRAV